MQQKTNVFLPAVGIVVFFSDLKTLLTCYCSVSVKFFNICAFSCNGSGFQNGVYIDLTITSEPFSVRNIMFIHILGALKRGHYSVAGKIYFSWMSLVISFQNLSLPQSLFRFIYYEIN